MAANMLLSIFVTNNDIINASPNQIINYYYRSLTPETLESMSAVAKPAFVICHLTCCRSGFNPLP